MLVSPLGFDVYHLGLYLLIATLWLALYLMLAFNARQFFPRWGAWGSLLAPTLAVALCAGILVLDVLFFLNRAFILGLLLLFGVLLPGVVLGCLYWRLRSRA